MRIVLVVATYIPPPTHVLNALHKLKVQYEASKQELNSRLIAPPDLCIMKFENAEFLTIKHDIFQKYI